MDSSFALVPMNTDTTDSNPIAECAPFLCATAFTLLALAMSSGSNDAPEPTADSDNEDVIENTETSIVPYVPKMTPETIQDAILSVLRVNRTPMTCKEILRVLRKKDPNLRKPDINRPLYKMISMKKVKKSNDSCPTWTLV